MSTLKRINILIPTYKRLKALAVTLTSLCYQSEKNFDIIISDQSPDDEIERDNSIQTIKRWLELQNNKVIIYKNLPRRGMAQQRQFLLDHSNAAYSLFLDDDLLMEPFVLRNILHVLESEQCGFVGCAVIGLSYKDDHRPQQQQIEFWKDHVAPEKIIPQSNEWQRYKLHSAANLFHIEQKYHPSADEPMRYKVAWVGGCVMYDTEKLRDVGGYEFWKELPQNHCGEDVLAQLRVMKKYGGCGIIPSGVYHQELETTVPDRTVNAPECLEI
jgi:glycosyltransferase involved in cell wall biosynthesis